MDLGGKVDRMVWMLEVGWRFYVFGFGMVVLLNLVGNLGRRYRFESFEFSVGFIQFEYLDGDVQQTVNDYKFEV